MIAPPLCSLNLVDILTYSKILPFIIEQAVVLCQVEKAKEDMLNQLYSSVRLVIPKF